MTRDARGEYRENLGARGMEAFQKSDFDSALAVFESGVEAHPDDFRFNLGAGASHYRRGQFHEAKAAFVLAASKAPDVTSKAAALYDAGNSQVQLGELEEAIRSYEESLKLVPDDKETKDNLAYARRLLKEREQKKDNQQKQQSSANQQNSDNKQNSDSSTADHSSTSSSSSEGSGNSQQDQGNQSSTQESNAEHNNSSSDTQSQSTSSEQSVERQQGANDNSNSSTGGMAGQSSSQSSSGDVTADVADDQSPNDATESQLEALLGNVDEKRDALLRYRKSMAQKELKEEQRQLPERDW